MDVGSNTRPKLLPRLIQNIAGLYLPYAQGALELGLELGGEVLLELNWLIAILITFSDDGLISIGEKRSEPVDGLIRFRQELRDCNGIMQRGI